MRFTKNKNDAWAALAVIGWFIFITIVAIYLT
jgi:hypothetical protein